MELEIVRKAAPATIKVVDERRYVVHAVISTGSVDRDGEIILPEAFRKRLDVYRANPLLCWGHPLGGGELGFGEVQRPDLIIGKALDIQVVGYGENARLEAEWQYAVDENPVARMCYELIVGEYLRAYSVGGQSHARVFDGMPDEVLDALPRYASSALRSGDCWLVHTEFELVEVSNVFAGSNRDALISAVRAGIIPKSVGTSILAKQWPRPVESSRPTERLVQIKRNYQAKAIEQFVRAYGADEEFGEGVLDLIEEALEEFEIDEGEDELAKLACQALAKAGRRAGAQAFKRDLTEAIEAITESTTGLDFSEEEILKIVAEVMGA